MAETKSKYASAVALTWTPEGLGSSTYDASAAVDNTSNLYTDVLVGGKITTGTSPASGGVITIYAYGSWDGTNYSAGISGSDGGTPGTGEEALIQLYRVATIAVDATSNHTYEWGPVSLAQVFGGVLPPKWGLVVYNGTSVALNATGSNHETKYTGLTYTTA